MSTTHLTRTNIFRLERAVSILCTANTRIRTSTSHPASGLIVRLAVNKRSCNTALFTFWATSSKQ